MAHRRMHLISEVLQTFHKLHCHLISFIAIFIPSFGFSDCHIPTQMMPFYIGFEHSTEIANDVRFGTHLCYALRYAQYIRPMHRVNVVDTAPHVNTSVN